jgi:outer membrane protein assembly factor BamB
MKSPICLVNRRQCASFRMACHMLAIAPLWLMLAAANLSAHGQTSDDISNSAAAAPSPADWTQFLRDNMQRWNPYETVLGVDSVGGLQLKWKNAIGGSGGSPVLANGIVYFNSGDGNVYALNASTGAKLWSYFEVSSGGGSPAVVNGVVYAGAYHYLYALNASTGALLWSSNISDTDAVSSSPAVANGVVYFTTARGGLTALNASTGAYLWSRGIGGLLSEPAVANGVVYISAGQSLYGSDTGLFALNANTGAPLWHFAVGGNAFAVANGVVYFGSEDFNVYALNASTGAKLWSYDTGARVGSVPAVANGVVYIGAVNGNVYALNANTGAKLWSYATGNQVYTSSAVANGVVYTVSGDHIYALNASTGALLWSYFTGLNFSSPIIVNGVVYVHEADTGNGEGNLDAFSVGADLFLRIQPTLTTVHQGDLLTFAFPVWNLGPNNADHEVLNTQIPAGTTFDYIRISGTPGLGTCTHPPYQGTGQIVCHENNSMAPNTTWTVRLTVKVTASPAATITANAATIADSLDPNMANNTATVSIKVQ